MKLIVSNPPTGTCKSIEIDDDKKLRAFYDKRLAQEVAADSLGDEFKGYIFKITGGNDKQGFPMMQGVLVQGRVRLLLKKGHAGFRPRRDGERKRKSVRGCIVGPDLSALSLVIVKKGDAELPGITDKYVPRRLGPKRASKIRKLFNLSKEDDVRKYANTYRREKPTKTKDGKTVKRYKTVNIQRLVTSKRIHNKKHEHKKRIDQIHKTRREAAAYHKLLKQRAMEATKKREQTKIKRRQSAARTSERRASSKKAKADAAAGTAAGEEKKGVKRARKDEKPATKKAGAKPAPKAGAKGSPKPAAKAGAKPAAKPAAKDAAKPAAKDAAKSAAKPPAKAPAKDAAKPAAKPASPKPAAKPEAKPAAKPAAPKPAAKPEAKPAAAKPEAKAAAKSSPKPAEKKQKK